MQTFKEELNKFCAVLVITTVVIGLGVLVANYEANKTIHIGKYTKYTENQSCIIGMSYLRSAYNIEADMIKCMETHAAAINRQLTRYIRK